MPAKKNRYFLTKFERNPEKRKIKQRLRQTRLQEDLKHLPEELRDLAYFPSETAKQAWRGKKPSGGGSRLARGEGQIKSSIRPPAIAEIVGKAFERSDGVELRVVVQIRSHRKRSGRWRNLNGLEKELGEVWTVGELVSAVRKVHSLTAAEPSPTSAAPGSATSNITQDPTEPD